MGHGHIERRARILVAHSPAGDVNGDGFSDLLVAAPDFDQGLPGQGKAFLFLGSSEGLLPSRTYLGSGADEHLGSSLSAGGDVNGNGYGDVFIGCGRGEAMRGQFTLGSTIATVLILGSSVGTARAGAFSGNASLMLGGKFLDETDWEPVERQLEFGVLATWGKKGWPVQIATDFTFSIEGGDPYEFSAVDPTGTTFEFAFGVRKIWKHKKLQPFLVGGLALLYGEQTRTVNIPGDGTGGGVGGWIDGGIYWLLGEVFGVGLEGRVSRGKITLQGEEVDAGGEHVGLIVGINW